MSLKGDSYRYMPVATVTICLVETFSGAAFQILGYSLEAPAPPFPVFVFGYFFNGLGISLQVTDSA